MSRECLMRVFIVLASFIFAPVSVFAGAHAQPSSIGVEEVEQISEEVRDLEFFSFAGLDLGDRITIVENLSTEMTKEEIAWIRDAFFEEMEANFSEAFAFPTDADLEEKLSILENILQAADHATSEETADDLSLEAQEAYRFYTQINWVDIDECSGPSCRDSRSFEQYSQKKGGPETNYFRSFTVTVYVTAGVTFSQRIEWNYDGSKIIHPAPLHTHYATIPWWQYVYEGPVGDTHTGGVGQTYYRAWVQGKISYCFPFKWSCLYSYYPIIDMTVYGNGGYTYDLD